ncbi:hypothetical protein ABZT02_41595 [Streptomyces sp. NPDC005402]|uniref:hypothetical protein n=1 Tax=Streptomyces sp. NPDC005402 TaxID=3155338 RepID=UPI0033A5126A
MISADGEQNLLSLADEIAQAVQRHALTASYGSDDPGALATEAESVRTLMERYGNLLGEAKEDVRNPFREIVATPGAADQGPDDIAKNEIELNVSYRLVVVNSGKAVDLAHSRARNKGDRSACVAPNSADSDLVSALFMIDGWDPRKYDQDVVRFLGESWQCKFAK